MFPARSMVRVPLAEGVHVGRLPGTARGLGDPGKSA